MGRSLNGFEQPHFLNISMSEDQHKAREVSRYLVVTNKQSPASSPILGRPPGSNRSCSTGSIRRWAAGRRGRVASRMP